LAEYLHVQADDLVYFPNPTTAVNMVARSLIVRRAGRHSDALRLAEGDEILTTDHEYGALDRTWEYVCREVGARYIHRAIPLPLPDPHDFVERFWSAVTPRTKVVYLSHITSPTALIFPVEELCRRAREAGILSIVDGAHAPSQLPLDVTQVGADIYVGACHKWLSAPKGSAFLYALPAVQRWLEPLVVSWGWESDRPGPSQFIDWHEWQGTRDVAAFLAVPDAIRFQAEHDWGAVRRHCHRLAAETRDRIVALTGLPAICAEAAFGQMFAAELPPCDLDALKRRLYDEHRIEAPVIRWGGRGFIRVSFQAYNDSIDADALVAALGILLPQVADADARRIDRA
jgi:isopenicillin-N epimerase